MVVYVVVHGMLDIYGWARMKQKEQQQPGSSSGATNTAKPKTEGLASRFRPKNFQRPTATPSSTTDGDVANQEIRSRAIKREDRSSSLHDRNLRSAEHREHGRRGGRGKYSGRHGDRSRDYGGASQGPRIQQQFVAFGGNVGAGATNKIGTEQLKFHAKDKVQSNSSAHTQGDSHAVRIGKSSSKIEPKVEVAAEIFSSDESMQSEDEICDDRGPIFLSRMDSGGPIVPEELYDVMQEEPQTYWDSMKELKERILESRNGSSDMMLFQLPSKLPIPSTAADEQVNSMQEGMELESNIPQASASCASLRDIPPTKLGKLIVFRSGRIKLKIGDVLFDVTPGAQVKARQEVAYVDVSSQKCAVLGNISQRIVVTPDVDSILDQNSIPVWKRVFESVEGEDFGKNKSDPVIKTEHSDERHYLDSEGLESRRTDDKHSEEQNKNKPEITSENNRIDKKSIEVDVDEKLEDEAYTHSLTETGAGRASVRRKSRASRI